MAFSQTLVYTQHIYKEITMVSSKLFLNNTTQAVRLPKEVAFPEGVTEVEIFVEGDTRVIVPKGQSLLAWMTTGPGFSEDFMVDRDQPSMPTDIVGMFD
jgi:antitoxin VapB